MIFLKKHLKSLFIFLSLFFALTAGADLNHGSLDLKIDRLLKDYKYRPTVEQVLNEFDGQLPSRDQVGEYISKNSERFYYDPESLFEIFDEKKILLLEEVALAIAQLEHVYPGATYFQLGRDGAYFGDILEAHFLANNEPGRVRRLRGSRDTINALDRKTGIDFLISNGFKGHVDRPQLIVDSTSYTSTSQSFALMQFADYYMRSQGFKRDQISQSLNVITVMPEGQWSYSSNANIELMKKKNYLQRAFSLPRAVRDLFYDGLQWHDTMTGQLVRVSGGALAGEISEPYDEHIRLLVLTQIIEAIRFTQGAEFQNKVKSNFKILVQEKSRYKPSCLDLLKRVVGL